MLTLTSSIGRYPNLIRKYNLDIKNSDLFVPFELLICIQIYYNIQEIINNNYKFITKKAREGKGIQV